MRHVSQRTSYGDLSDEVLLGLIASGEERALAAVYDRYGRLSYGLAYRLLREAGLAEGAVQQTFLGVWRAAFTFAPERGSGRTWILTLARRCAVDMLRREGRRRWEPIDAIEDPAGEGAPAAASHLALRQGVQSALECLPDDQRRALELAYYGGYTQSEIAERLGEPLGTVKRRIFDGLTRLRALLTDMASPLQSAARTPAAARDSSKAATASTGVAPH